jgi:uncharacterized circularly permuted ATP-grasp superfamily protein/uncharacterized alpha-E superfamily protein
MANADPGRVKSIFERLEHRGNEARGRGGRWAGGYRNCLDAFARMRPGELARRQDFIVRATEDLDLHTDRLGRNADAPGVFSMDLFPRILRPGEWRRIEAGVLQRMEAFGALVRDIQGSREILRAGVLPPALVFEDPAFHPELHGVPLGAGNPVTIGAVDLVRTGEGEWQVLENRFSTPAGISHVIQTRRILVQALPELFERLPVVPVASFVARMAEALAEAARPADRERPLVVLLSEGESGRHFFEEGFLARHMGIPLTRPADIVVREGQVCLKTIEGLHRIDVIYRRMEPAALDPVAFASANGSGIPGLVQCLRRGSVRVVNAMGCAIADNRALLRHADAIIRHYTGQHPLLRTVPTFHGHDADQAEWMADHADSLSLKAVCHPELLRHANPKAAARFGKGDLAGLLREDPRLVVAQELPELDRLPVYHREAPSLEPFSMRVYCLSGRRPYVLPGGLTRLFPAGHERLLSGKRFHVLKDTWTLHQKQPRSRSGGRLEREISADEIPLPSRAAEAFYWMGRYLERGRATARLVNTLEELRWGELSPGERELYAPLWRGILRATSEEHQALKSIPEETAPLVRNLLLDADNPVSARACYQMAQRNAEGIRSFITPELWRALGKAASRFPDRPGRLSGPRLRDFIESVIESGDHVFGAAQRTLLHDAGWHFLNIGMLLERGLTHVVIQLEVLPRIAMRQWQHLRDDSDLTALLRLLGALDAYHRRYRSRAYLDRVAQLLWTSAACTASVRHAAAGIEDQMRGLERATRRAIVPQGVLDELTAFLQWLADLPLDKLFPARALELDRGLTRKSLAKSVNTAAVEAALERMLAFFESLHEGLEDRLFSHHPDAVQESP